ncbi:MAG: OmpA family protein [Pseudomonadota bacterium]
MAKSWNQAIVPVAAMLSAVFLALPTNAAEPTPPTDPQFELTADAGYCAIYRALTNRLPAGCSEEEVSGMTRAIVLRSTENGVTTEPLTQVEQPAPWQEWSSEDAGSSLELSSLARSLRYPRKPHPPNASNPGPKGYFIHFAFDSAEIDKDYRDHLAKLSKVMAAAALGETCLRIVGHADSVGTDAYNTDLSRRRAMVVADYLTGQAGLPDSRIIWEGMGEREPLQGVDTEHPRNRRVEFQLSEDSGSCT